MEERFEQVCFIFIRNQVLILFRKEGKKEGWLAALLLNKRSWDKGSFNRIKLSRTTINKVKRHGVQEVKVKYLPESGTLNQEQTDFWISVWKRQNERRWKNKRESKTWNSRQDWPTISFTCCVPHQMTCSRLLLLTLPFKLFDGIQQNTLKTLPKRERERKKERERKRHRIMSSALLHSCHKSYLCVSSTRLSLDRFWYSIHDVKC